MDRTCRTVAPEPRPGLAMCRRWLRRAARFFPERRGSALVEFAFVSPGLILALLGTAEFGYFFWNRHSLEFAAEESARMILTKQTITDDEITADVKSRIINIDTNVVTAAVSRETIGVTTFVTLSVGYTYNYMFGGVFGLEPFPMATKVRVPLRQMD
jgi:Flp pilus assembly protein TadG